VTPDAAVMNAHGHVANAALAADGVQRIEWAEREMPVLRQIRAQFEKDKPLRGKRLPRACT